MKKLHALVGKYVNLEYRLPNGRKVKFLDDQITYLGNQLESEFAGDGSYFLRKILLDKYPVGVYKVRKETKHCRIFA